MNEIIGIIKELKRRKKEERFLVWKAYKRRKGYLFWKRMSKDWSTLSRESS